MQLVRPDKKDIFQTFWLVIGYGLFFLAFYLFLYKITMVSVLPDDLTLLRWDAGIYKEIMDKGYAPPAPPHLVGWYFLFPWVWKLLHVSVTGISVVNYVFFAAGFSLVCGIYKLTVTEKLLWMSLPALFIMMTPYSEALFFLFGAMAMFGIAYRIRWLIWSGLFLLALTRANAIFLFAALLAMELLSNPRKDWYRCLRRYLIDYALPLGLGLGFFIWYKYYCTHIWFGYFTYQQTDQGHVFGGPTLPFANFTGQRMLWINALALCCTFVALLQVIRKAVLWLKKDIQETDKLFILSLVFMIVTGYKTVFYNPTWGENRTLLFGTSRYVFATSFFLPFLYRVMHPKKEYKRWHYLYVFLVANAIWLTCGSYVHLQQSLYMNFGTLLMVLWMLQSNKKMEWPKYALLSFGFFMQVILYYWYLLSWFPD